MKCLLSLDEKGFFDFPLLSPSLLKNADLIQAKSGCDYLFLFPLSCSKKTQYYSLSGIFLQEKRYMNLHLITFIVKPLMHQVDLFQVQLLAQRVSLTVELLSRIERRPGHLLWGITIMVQEMRMFSPR